MNNIFEGAKFGDKFVTRDGREAVLISLSTYAICAVKNYTNFNSVDFEYMLNGQTICNVGDGVNIVSRYQEPIDNTKLEILIDKNVPKSPFFSTLDYDNWSDGFKAGYKQRVMDE